MASIEDIQVISNVRLGSGGEIPDIPAISKIIAVTGTAFPHSISTSLKLPNAGNIGSVEESNFENFLNNLADKFSYVLIVPGNEEYL